MKFLQNPAQIRKCLVEGLRESDSLDAAVAFIGSDWADLIGTFSGKIRVICWLSSTNTNPYAVEQMMGRDNIRVRQLPAMHAKVYVLKGKPDRCIVGSANLTSAALSEENASGQHEAAMCAASKKEVRDARKWFNDLWKESKPVSQSGIDAAKERWEQARSNENGPAMGNGNAGAPHDNDPLFPGGWTPPRDLVKLADKVRNDDLSQFTQYEDLLSRLVNNGRQGDVQELIQCVASWTGHAGAYQPALNERPRRIREAFRVLFDAARPIESRLQDLKANGPCKISGFALRSLTMILYWRFPKECPPFNGRTQEFLQDFGLEHHVPMTLSPAQYGKWIAFAQELSARLQLPSTGHVDRLVWKHTH